MTSPLFSKLEQESRKLLMDRSVEGRIGATLPDLDVPEFDLPPSNLIREDLPLPEVSEGEIVRYFTQISQYNFSIDNNFYPLGSCTMKYNPKLNDLVASMPGFSNIHPLQDDATVQGALQLVWEVQEYLTEITGMAGTCLTPMAGADGELAGMLMARAYHLDRGDDQRKVVLIPDSAHGTNPASAVMAGFTVKTLPSDSEGNTDLDALQESVGDDLAGLMITLPSTLGLFDRNILEVTRIVRESGGIVYGDGANLNALLGRVKMGDLGFDVIHSNLHKTFSTPHGGGGPGAGPVIAGPRLVDYLPSPVMCRENVDGRSVFKRSNPGQSIGRMGAFQGNFGVLARAFTYIRSLGGEGIRSISDDAVVNANYILERLKDSFDLPYERVCMHEVVFSARNLKNNCGVSALDVAKRLIDYGVHPPTMYFPLIVEEALMVEPTETESLETLDTFIDIMRTISEEAHSNPELLHDAPHFTPNTRLDEARAARFPDLRWRPSHEDSE